MNGKALDRIFSAPESEVMNAVLDVIVITRSRDDYGKYNLSER